MLELVSILIPAYNAEKWIAQTLNSALAQTWPRKEVIVVDDGSSDRTFEIARSFESRSVKIIMQKNAGPCAARNLAITHCQGDFIQWLDADDLLAPDKIERQIQRAEGGAQSRIALSSACGVFYHRPQKARFIPTPLWTDMNPVDWLIQYFSGTAAMVVHTWLISRALTELAGPWDVRLSRTDGDGEYFSRVVSASKEVRFVLEAHSFYRRGLPNSMSAARFDIKEEELLYKLFIGHLLSLEDSDRTRDACLQLLQLWIKDFHIINPDCVDTANSLAKSINRSLAPAPLSWKFVATQKVLGGRCARNAQRKIARFRSQVAASWDKFLSFFSPR